MTGSELPVHVLYDKEKVDENSNIKPELVVPVGAARTRSQNDHDAGQRVYTQIRDGVQLRGGWVLHPPNADDPRLRLISKYNPRDPKQNVIDTHITGVLRLSRGILGFGSIQSTSALAAKAAQQNGEGMVPSLTGTPPGRQGPQTTGQLAAHSAKDVGKASMPVLKRMVVGNSGSNGNGKHR